MSLDGANPGPMRRSHANGGDLPQHRVEQACADIDQKRRSTAYRHTPPLRFKALAELLPSAV